MRLFRRSAPAAEPIDLDDPVDWGAAKRAAAAVNRGDSDEAQRIVEATAHPRHTAFAAFRFIDLED
jgi:hypothetical protein